MVDRTRTEGGGYSKHDAIAIYDQQAGCNIIVDGYYITILRTNANTVTRIEGGNVGIIILFNNIHG